MTREEVLLADYTATEEGDGLTAEDAVELYERNKPETAFTDEQLDHEYIEKMVGKYTYQQKVEYLKLNDDIQAYEDHNPAYRFRLINKHQVDFLRCLAQSPRYKYLYLSAGNQGGKTAVLIFSMYLVAKGMLRGFPHKPRKGMPLVLLLCGATDKIIKHSLIPELEKWAAPGEISIKKGSSGSIDHVLVKTKKGLPDTKIICMSYKAGAESFVSFKAHAVFCDEPFTYDILEEILPRTTAYNAPICIAATKTPAHSGPRYRWLKELYKGLGKFKRYHDQNKVKIITASSYDNKVLTKEAIDDTLGLHDPNSAVYRMRVQGIPDDPEGPVYDTFKAFKFADDGETHISWNVGGWEDLAVDIPDLTAIGTYDVYGGLDYGNSAPFSALNIFVSRLTGTVWVVDECYRARLKPYEQMRRVKDMYQYWGVVPTVIVCDDQINNPESGMYGIKDQYEDAIEQMAREDNDRWDVYLYADRSTKKNKAHGIALLSGLFSRINPKTGKPMLRILSRCQCLIDELESMLWKESNNTQRHELTQGADHAESALRYWACSAYGFENPEV